MIAFAFISLGFLVGHLAGFSADGVTKSLLPLLFAFVGGSAVAFMQKLQQSDRNRAAIAIIALSLSCLVGLYSGIVVSEYQWLSPDREVALATRPSVKQRKYLMEHVVPQAKAIDTKLSNEELTQKQAYDQLYELLIMKSKEG
jgi:hypothetical protein